MKKIVKSGEIIFLEGEPGDCAYILEKGRVNLSILVNGEQKWIKQLRPGTLFGEMALIGDRLRSASAVACEDTELLLIPEKYFAERLEQADSFIALLLKTSLQRYFEMRSRLEYLLKEASHNEIWIMEDDPLPEMAAETIITTQQLEAENALKHALECGQLALFYQPIVNLTNGETIGCEALIRWLHPERGLIPPCDFIGLAEESGLIIPIGLWIIEEAVKASLDFVEQSEHFAFVSVNLSGKQFLAGDLLENINVIFEKYAIPPKMIKFEITESILMANPLDTAAMLLELKNKGSTIALDDFGTGYSSFSYLHRFPIDTLKIDRSFVSTMLTNPKSYEIVKSLSVLARSIGMTIVAEGIENAEEGSILTEMGANYGQGYLYAKPLPKSDFENFLVNH